MKRMCLLGVLLAVFSFSLFSQGLYFDASLGYGMFKETKSNDTVISLSGLNDIGVDLGLKLGFAPISTMPVYLVGVIGGCGHRFYDATDHIQFNAYLVGGGVVFYPIPFLQIAGSAGYSFVANQSSLPTTFYNSTGGFAWDVSAAVDIGSGKNGWLFGARYFNAVNTLEVSGVKQENTQLSLYCGYAFRNVYKPQK